MIYECLLVEVVASRGKIVCVRSQSFLVVNLLADVCEAAAEYVVGFNSRNVTSIIGNGNVPLFDRVLNQNGSTDEYWLT